MAARPRAKQAPASYRLAPFIPAWASDIAAWVHGAQEAYWLAPKTPVPITARHITSWQEPGHAPYVLLCGGTPAAYGELNVLTGGVRQYWLGHLVVDPALRGKGVGLRLTRALLDEAFARRGAARVTLVVFPENEAAIHCYRRAGMVDDGWEWHRFPLYGRRECLLRMSISAQAWPVN